MMGVNVLIGVLHNLLFYCYHKHIIGSIVVLFNGMDTFIVYFDSLLVKKCFFYFPKQQFLINS